MPISHTQDCRLHYHFFVFRNITSFETNGERPDLPLFNLYIVSPSKTRFLVTWLLIICLSNIYK